MNIKSYFKAQRDYTDYQMPTQVIRFGNASVFFVVIGLISLWITTQTELLDSFGTPTEDLIDLYSTMVITFGSGTVLLFIGRFLKVISDNKTFIRIYYDLAILVSVFLYMKWGTHSIYLVQMEGREADYLIWATVYAGVGCVAYIEPTRFVLLVVINLAMSFYALPARTGSPFSSLSKYNMIFFSSIIVFWMTMKYIAGLIGFRRMKAIEASKLEKVAFLKNVSAEIGQGLQNLSVRNDYMVHSAPNEDYKKRAKQIDGQITILKAVSEDIADMARIEAEIVAPVIAPYKTEKFFDEIIDLSREYVGGKGLKFKYEFSENIPSVLRGDANRIRNVILRLVTNAVRYTQEGSITLKVDFVREAGLKGKLLVSILDTGVGIREDELDALNARIGRMKDERTGKVTGVNLGITVAAGILFSLGGTMSVSSVYRRGTEISFEIEQEVVSTPVIKAHDTESDGDVAK